MSEKLYPIPEMRMNGRKMPTDTTSPSTLRMHSEITSPIML